MSNLGCDFQSLFSWNGAEFQRVERLYQQAAGKYANTVATLSVIEGRDYAAWNLALNFADFSSCRDMTPDFEGLRLALNGKFGILSAPSKSFPRLERLATLLFDATHRQPGPLTADEMLVWYAHLKEHALNGVGTWEIQRSTRSKQRPPDDLADVTDAQLAPLLFWLNSSVGTDNKRHSALIKAGVTYYWLEKTALFGELSRNMAIVIAGTILGQENSDAIFIGLSTTFRKYNQTHSDMLQSDNDNLTAWLLWFAAKVVEAQKRQAAQLEFSICADRLIQRVGANLNWRQSRSMLHIREEGPDGFPHGFTAADHMKITETSVATASRDLADLVKMGALLAKGKHKWRRYFLNVPRNPVPMVSIELIL